MYLFSVTPAHLPLHSLTEKQVASSDLVFRYIKFLKFLELLFPGCVPELRVASEKAWFFPLLYVLGRQSSVVIVIGSFFITSVKFMDPPTQCLGFRVYDSSFMRLFLL